MTVESQYKPARYEGNGIAATFPFSWLCLDPAWVRATVTEAKVDVELTPGKDFSVALLADSPGGSVTLPAPLPQGKKITVWMSVPITQEHAYQNAGQLNVNTLEHAHDKHTLIDQQLRADVDRSIKVPISSDDPPEILAELIFEARDQAYASAADAAASEAHAAASAETAAALLEEITTEHGTALEDLGAVKADALTAVTQLRDTSLADMTQLRDNTLDAVTREGQLQVGNVQQAASNVTLITTQAITDILDTGAQQEQRLRSVGDEQALNVILEGNAQESRVHASAAQATVEIAAQVQVASAEADRAKREADRAQDISNIGPASKTQRGWMIVGNGLRVDPDGKVHADIPSFLSLPVTGFPADVAIGYPATLSLSSETSIAGATVNRFMVVFDGAPAVEVQADTPGHATWTVTPTGTVHDQVGNIIVTAYDSNGNASNDATITFTKKIVEVAAPLVLSPVSGAVDVALLPVVTVQEGGTTGMPSTNEKTQVQIARDAAFTDVVWDSGEITYATSVTVTSLLPDDAPLHSRARHKVSTYGWSAWGRASGFTTIKKAVIKPRILAPAQGAVNQSLTSTITLSALQTTGLAPAGRYTQVQLARDAAFADVVWDSGDASAYGVSKATSNLPVNTYLYCRGRHNDSNLGWSAWADTVSFTTLNAYTNKPAVTAPANNAVDVARKPTFQFSPISNVGPVDYGVETQIHVATDAGFTSIIWNYQGGYLTQWVYPADLGIFAQYYVRVRHRGAAWGWSAWSDTVTFKTLNIYVNPPQVIAPANGATGVGLTPLLQMSQATAVNDQIQQYAIHLWSKADRSDIRYLGYTMSQQVQVVEPLNINTLYYLSPHAKGNIIDWTYGNGSSFRTVNGWVNAPTLTSPTANATVAGDEVYFASSAFSVSHTTDTHVATEFALNKVVNGADVGFWNSGELTGASLLALKANIPNFEEDVQYRAYVRHKGRNLGWGAWSAGVPVKLARAGVCYTSNNKNYVISSDRIPREIQAISSVAAIHTTISLPGKLLHHTGGNNIKVYASPVAGAPAIDSFSGYPSSNSVICGNYVYWRDGKSLRRVAKYSGVQETVLTSSDPATPFGAVASINGIVFWLGRNSAGGWYNTITGEKIANYWGNGDLFNACNLSWPFYDSVRNRVIVISSAISSMMPSQRTRLCYTEDGWSWKGVDWPKQLSSIGNDVEEANFFCANQLGDIWCCWKDYLMHSSDGINFTPVTYENGTSITLSSSSSLGAIGALACIPRTRILVSPQVRLADNTWSPAIIEGDRATKLDVERFFYLKSFSY